MPDISIQLIEAVNSARADGRSLNLCGHGSKAFLGREAKGESLALVGHSGIVSYQPVELVMTVRAGTSLSDIESALAEKGQMLAFEPPRFASTASIGGTLAANVSGPCRPWSGSVRDAVLGTRLINGRGEHLRFGGQVIKNVAGFDVSRLQAGAMGTLGIVTEISLKLAPRPEGSVTLTCQCDVSDAVQTMNRKAAAGLPLSAACWLDGSLLLRLSGARAALDAAAARWPGTALAPDAARAFWLEQNNHRLPYFAGATPLWRFSVSPTAAVDTPAGAEETDWLVDWGGAQRWLRGDFERAQLEAMAVAAGGQVTLFRGGDRTGDVFHPLPAPMRALQRRVKAAMDPQGIFNPGRLYSWL